MLSRDRPSSASEKVRRPREQFRRGRFFSHTERSLKEEEEQNKVKVQQEQARGQEVRREGKVKATGGVKDHIKASKNTRFQRFQDNEER